jgi:Fe-S cluster biosynthesis and repair protein YggX
MNWMDIIKVKQVVTPTTDVNIKKVPKKKKPEDKKCCEEAVKAYFFADLKEHMNYARILYNDNKYSIAEASLTIEELLDYEKNGPSQDNFDESEVFIRGICSSLLQTEVLKTILEGKTDSDYRGHLGKEVWQKIIDDWKACEKW